MNLPNGEPAESLDEYVSVWADLAKPICDATGFELFCYDPLVGLTNGDGEIVYLPVRFVEIINTRLRIAERAIKVFYLTTPP